MESDFKWICRYSNDGKSDKHGRWARLCYYKGKLFCWINRVDHIDYGRYYSTTDFFPTLNSDNPCLTKGIDKREFSIIQKEAEDRINKFISEIIV
jgi:hypothetical protein